MKTLMIMAALATGTAYSNLDVKLSTVDTASKACAERVVGKQLLGVGLVKKAEADPADGSKFLIQIQGASGGQTTMKLSGEQLCDFADSLETTAPGGN